MNYYVYNVINREKHMKLIDVIKQFYFIFDEVKSSEISNHGYEYLDSENLLNDIENFIGLFKIDISNKILEIELNDLSDKENLNNILKNVWKDDYLEFINEKNQLIYEIPYFENVYEGLTSNQSELHGYLNSIKGGCGFKISNVENFNNEKVYCEGKNEKGLLNYKIYPLEMHYPSKLDELYYFAKDLAVMLDVCLDFDYLSSKIEFIEKN